MRIIRRLISMVLVFALFVMCVPTSVLVSAENIKMSTESNDTIYYSDLFFGYPYYLSNDYSTKYTSLIKEGYTDVLSSYTDFDLVCSALQTGTKDSWSILINSAWTSVVGEEFELSSSLKNKAMDKATLEIMKCLYSNETTDQFFSTSSEVSKAVKGFKNLLSAGSIAGGVDSLTAIDESMIVKEVSDAFPNISSSEIERFIKVSKSNEIVGKFKAGDVIDFVENAELSIKILATYALLYEVSLAEIDTLMNSIDSSTLFYQSLSRIRKSAKGNFAQFAIEEIKKDKSLDAVTGFCNKLVVSLVSDSQLATLMAKMIISTGMWITFNLIYPVADAEDLLTAIYLSQMSQEIENAIVDKQLLFFDVFTSTDIVQYEALYNAYIATMIATLNATESCCKTDDDKYKIRSSKAFAADYSYENYITFCKNKIASLPEEKRITRKPDSDKITVSSNEFRILPASDSIEYGKIYLFNDMVLHGLLFRTAFAFSDDATIDGNIDVGVWQDNTFSNDKPNKLTIPEGIKIKVNGDLNIQRKAHYTGQLIIDGSLTIEGNATVERGYQIKMTKPDSYLCVYGTLTTYTDSDLDWFDLFFIDSCGVNASDGKIELKGDLKYFMIPESSNCTVIFSGDKKQTISGHGNHEEYNQFSNLIVLNTSIEGVVLDYDIRITGEYRSPIKKINQNGHYVRITSPSAEFFSENYYGDIIINCVYTMKNPVAIDGNVIVEGDSNKKNSLTILENTEICVSGSVSTKYGGTYAAGQYGYINIYGKLIVGKNFNTLLCSLVKMEGDNAYLLVHGDIDLYSGSTSRSECNILNGIVESKGNIKNFVLPNSSKNTLILSGDKLQTMTQSTNKFNIVEIRNDSEEGVKFSGTVYTLFNHNQKVYSASGTFPDYDGDGLKDNVDPYPLVGNMCRINVSSENSDKGNVSDSIEIIGGTTVEVTAVPKKGYAFDYWENQSGKKVSENSTYRFVARSNEVLVAHFNDVLMGDVNLDDSFNVSDVVLLQKWLLAVPDTNLSNWSAADFCEDDKLDVFDLCLMKRALIEQ